MQREMREEEFEMTCAHQVDNQSPVLVRILDLPSWFFGWNLRVLLEQVVGDLRREEGVHGLRLLRDQTFKHVLQRDSAAPEKYAQMMTSIRTYDSHSTLPPVDHYLT